MIMIVAQEGKSQRVLLALDPNAPGPAGGGHAALNRRVHVVLEPIAQQPGAMKTRKRVRLSFLQGRVGIEVVMHRRYYLQCVGTSTRQGNVALLVHT